MRQTSYCEKGEEKEKETVNRQDKNDGDDKRQTCLVNHNVKVQASKLKLNSNSGKESCNFEEKFLNGIPKSKVLGRFRGIRKSEGILISSRPATILNGEVAGVTSEFGQLKLN